MTLADRQILGAGNNGYGTYCSKCGKWKGDYTDADLTYNCWDCGSKDFTVYTPHNFIYVKETS